MFFTASGAGGGAAEGDWTGKPLPPLAFFHFRHQRKEEMPAGRKSQSGRMNSWGPAARLPTICQVLPASLETVAVSGGAFAGGEH